MQSLFRSVRRILRPPSPPHHFASAGFRLLDKNVLIDEEREPFYSPTFFYPVRIGQVLHSRYQIVGKLGYGGYSTVWLGRDLVDHKFVALKLCRSDAPHTQREIDAYKHLHTLKTKHAGGSLVRTMLDSFEIVKDETKYPCMVHPPLGISLADLRKRLPDRKLPEPFLKLTLIHILIALEYLHDKARIVHADDSILNAYGKEEHENPVARKVDGDRLIYEVRKIDNIKNPGRPVLTDFGEARMGHSTYNGLIQPRQYRAPEVLLELDWGEKVDIWNVGVMIWDLFEGKNLFKAGGSEEAASKVDHLAHMMALLGAPPSEMLQHSPVASQYFNTDGSWKSDIEIPRISLEDSEKNLHGENKAMFLNFIRKMLKWRPEDRCTAGELLRDPWLRDRQQFADT